MRGREKTFAQMSGGDAAVAHQKGLTPTTAESTNISFELKRVAFHSGQVL